MSTDYTQTILIWESDRASDHIFNVIALITLVSFLVLAMVISSIRLPKPDRAVQAAIPERIARYITERSKPEPKPEVTPQAAQLLKPEPQIQRPLPAERKPLTKIEEQARKGAQGSGLLALAKELSALTDTSNVNSVITKKIDTSPTNTVAAAVDTRILSTDTGRGSGGVRPESHVATIGTTKLEDNPQRLTQDLLATRSEKPLGPTGGSASPGQGNSVRRDENVAVVMDQHKSMLYSIYNRARRTNPGLKGKIVLVITILPSGQVADVVIKSSELHAPDLEASLVARIRQFDFGKRQGGVFTVTVPVEFLPS